MTRIPGGAPPEPITIAGRTANPAAAEARHGRHQQGSGDGDPRGLDRRVVQNEAEVVATAREKADVVRAAALFDVLRSDGGDGASAAQNLKTLLAGASAAEIADLKRTLRAIEHPAVPTPGADPDTELAKDWREGKYP